MLIIGLTGGIGSGKSTAAERFRHLGVPVIDADAIARELAQPGQAGFAAIVDHFGPEILDETGHIDRRRLREIVFRDPAAKRALETILHPLVRREMQDQAARLTADYCIFMIPLLFESGQDALVDRVLVIDAPEHLQRQRTRQRDGVDEQQVQRIMAQQIDRQTRLSLADDVIHNSGDMDQLHAAVDALHRRYQRLARHAPGTP